MDPISNANVTPLENSGDISQKTNNSNLQKPSPNSKYVFITFAVIMILLLGIGLNKIILMRRIVTPKASPDTVISAANKPSTLTNNLQYLKVRGDKIVNEDGSVIYLRGFQGFGSYAIDKDFYRTSVFEKGQDPYTFDAYAEELEKYNHSEIDVNEVKSTGANVVRIWYLLHEIEKKPYEYSDTALKLLENKVNAFGKAGIYSILVQSAAGQHDFEDNEWYVKRGKSMWDDDRDLWNRSVGLLGKIAERFKDNPYVAGYDVVNEAKAPSRTALNEYYQDAIDEIRKYDRRHIIILEVDVAKKEEHQLGGRYKDDNLVASFHFYYPRDFTLETTPANLTYPGRYCHIQSPNCQPRDWNKNALEQIFTQALNLPDLKGIPVYVGEFGANASRDPYGLIWIDDVMSIMNKYNLHYTYHNYRHRVFQGYWIMKPESKQKLQRLINDIGKGSLKFEDLTESDKQLLDTESNYYRRDGIKELLTKYFKGI